jgi:hypothetical protein
MKIGILTLLVPLAFLIVALVMGFSRNHRKDFKPRSQKRPRPWIILALVVIAGTVAGGVFTSFVYYDKAKTSATSRLHEIMWSRLASKGLQLKQDGDHLVIQTFDDHEAWQNLEVLVPEGHEPPPEWAQRAAGSVREPRSSGDLDVLTRWPDPNEPVIVGYSTTPAEVDEAKDVARTAAASHLIANLLWYMHPRVATPSSFDSVVRSLASSRLVFDELDVLIEDRYEEKVPRPAGQFHRAAVMVRADPTTLDRLARQLARISGVALVEPRDSSSSSRVETLMAQPITEVEVSYEELPAFAKAILVAALIAAIFLTWLFLSAGSRGRWSWSLRLLTFALLGALYWFIFWFSAYSVKHAELFERIQEIK